MTTIPGSRQVERYSLPPTVDTIRLWQHFSSVAGDDKNKMITISNWLLTGSATIVGYLYTATTADTKKGTVSALGFAVSFLALYIVCLYGSHERWNRSKAEKIVASDATLQLLLPQGDRPIGGVWVFGFYFVLALLSLVAQIVVAGR